MRKEAKMKREKKKYFLKKEERKSSPNPLFLGAGSPHFQKGPFWPLGPCRKNTNDEFA
jgi:hypothetical protein